MPIVALLQLDLTAPGPQPAHGNASLSALGGPRNIYAKSITKATNIIANRFSKKCGVLKKEMNSGNVDDEGFVDAGVVVLAYPAIPL